jgi:hypothetical protein
MTSIYFTSPPKVCIFSGQYRGRRGRDHMVVGFILLMQSVPITTNLSFRFQRRRGILYTTLCDNVCQ